MARGMRKRRPDHRPIGTHWSQVAGGRVDGTREKETLDGRFPPLPRNDEGLTCSTRVVLPVRHRCRHTH